MAPSDPLNRWTIRDAEEMYGIGRWSNGYFDVSPEGEVRAVLRANGHTRPIPLPEIIAGIRERGMSMPVLLRFGDILDDRIRTLNESFAKAIADAKFQGPYRGVFPIKVNQQQQVVEEIAGFGRHYHHGLEAGSKAELIAAMSYISDPEAFIVCNGYKDEAFIDLALYALKMGVQVVMVLEMPSELETILERAARMGVRPRIGMRVKLSTKGSGHWIESAGDKSVFGLNTAQIMDVVDRLRAADMLDCLHMLHYHVGSQLPSIQTVRLAATEAARVYASLVQEGAPMGLLNVGGGLAVDYDGSHTNFASSSNYTVQEFCVDIVEAVMQVLDQAGVDHPTLISESGRATVAYYSVLVFDILDVSRFETHSIPDALPENAHPLVQNLHHAWRTLSPKNLQEGFNDALYYRDELRTLFIHGVIGLRERALAEQIFWNIIRRIASEAERLKYVPEEIQNLEITLADIYYGNFSLFQSLPDSWAIDQLFPIAPIHRLHEPPSRLGILADCTCDCDGKIDRFIDLHDVKKALPLHTLRDGEPYLIGAFLVGAYQETLGDLHNLFGDTNVVSVRLGPEGEVKYSREIFGDSVADVLSYVEYDPKAMVERMRDQAESAVRSGRITAQERRQIMRAFEEGLRGYTYFETDTTSG